MLKLTKTGIGLLTKQYRSVLRKCWAINEGLFWATIFPMIITSNISFAIKCSDLTSSSSIADIVSCLNQNNVAIGSSTDVSSSANSWSVAIGGQAKAKGYSSVAIGDYAQAEENYSVAIGLWARSRGNYSVALGSESFTSENYVVSVGHSVGDLNYSSGTYSKNLYRRIVNVADGINAHDAVTLGQLNDALNYYYTKTEADARYAKLSGGNTFTGSQKIGKNANEVDVILGYDNEGGNVYTYNRDGKRTALITNNNSLEGQFILGKDSSSRAVLTGADAGGNLQLLNSSGIVKTILSDSSFQLNGSLSATGIDFAANVTAGTTNASHLTTTGAVNQLLNYYYTFWVDERDEVIEFAEELISNKKEMSSLDFMPIKSSSDLRINLIKAEDPLTFSLKTRDDSLDLMEVRHA